mmetsp:Transcript_11383/g.35990  ORF Transcript_11383/g.35990 Transcript_11383/m.35990 type:complete len:225 (-) Transcript_11383:4-678(-)
MVARPKPAHGVQQLLAPRVVAPARALVAVARGRAVRDEHIDAFGDLPPPLGARLAAREVEGPVAELGLPRAAVHAQPADDRLRVLQVGHVRALRQQRAHALAVALLVVEALPVLLVKGRVEGDVVVARDHHLVRMWQAREPPLEREHLLLLARVRKVARVDQHVAGRHAVRHPAVEAVRVRDTDEAHEAGRRRRARVGDDRRGGERRLRPARPWRHLVRILDAG